MARRMNKQLSSSQPNNTSGSDQKDGGFSNAPNQELSSANPSSDVPRACKEWQSNVTKDLRNHFVGKLIKAMFPESEDISTVSEEVVKHARNVDKEFFEAANDREEYYHMLADWIRKVQKQLQEKVSNGLGQDGVNSFQPPMMHQTPSDHDVHSLPASIGTNQEPNGPVGSTESSANFSSDVPKITKEWQSNVTKDLRNHIVGRLIKLAFPKWEDRLTVPEEWVKYARNAEEEFFEAANDEGEYYQFLADWIYKELQEKKSNGLGHEGVNSFQPRMMHETPSDHDLNPILASTEVNQEPSGPMGNMGSSANPSPDVPITVKEWQSNVTKDLRNHLARKLFNAMLPEWDSLTVPEEKMNHAKSIENEFFEVANDRDEYYILLADKIHEIGQQYQEKQLNGLGQEGVKSSQLTLQKPYTIQPTSNHKPHKARTTDSTKNRLFRRISKIVQRCRTRISRFFNRISGRSQLVKKKMNKSNFKH